MKQSHYVSCQGLGKEHFTQKGTFGWILRNALYVAWILFIEKLQITKLKWLAVPTFTSIKLKGVTL
jgi:hypothetical protein